MTWLDAASLYLPTLNRIEDSLGLPTNLLARVAFQESSFRGDVISGAVKSSAGAVGMFQLMPEYFPNAGVNWETDANVAGNLLKSLYTRFKDWTLVCAAYNDGQGNISMWLKGQRDLPDETIKYVNDVVADVPLKGMLA